MKPFSMSKAVKKAGRELTRGLCLGTRAVPDKRKAQPRYKENYYE